VAGSITLRVGDITTDRDVDAIVNAANSKLSGGDGVDGAIHAAAGPSVLEECRALGGCRPGHAKITGAGDLPARYIIHAVGPIWHGGERNEPTLLASCYRRAVELADERACRRVAFPALSTGAYRYPLRGAARIALETVAASLDDHPNVREARFWLFDEPTFAVFQEELDRLTRSA
jgi:O-acetyl-ADP-ribose deacetylase (regulator of RNase III)